MFLARRHWHRLVLHPLVQLQYTLRFPSEEERIACRSETVTRNFEKENSFSLQLKLESEASWWSVFSSVI